MTAPAKFEDVKHGGRRLRVGDTIRIRGLRGEFCITNFYARGSHDELNMPAVEVEVYGGPKGGVRMFRTVTLDRVGTRKALAGAPT